MNSEYCVCVSVCGDKHLLLLWLSMYCQMLPQHYITSDYMQTNTYCNESCRICFLARTYIALAIRPTTSTRPSAQAAAPNNAGPWDGARAGANDWLRGGETPLI